MTLSLDFDILLLLILVAMIYIGFITGATSEFIKLMKVIIPFLIVFYFGGHIARLIFHSSYFNMLINKVSSLNTMPYFNTLIMCVSTIIAFFGSYFVISLIINYIKKKIQTEIVTYKLGKFNNSFGAILSVVRFYILASILIIPFYVLNITNKEDDFTTKLIIENPPVFTRIGHIVNSSEPVLNITNALANFDEIVNINRLREDYKVVTDIKGIITSYEAKTRGVYEDILLEENTIDIGITNPSSNEILIAFLNNPEVFENATSNDQTKNDINDLKTRILPYKGLILWANTKDLSQLSSENESDKDPFIRLFVDEYELIQTTDEKMKNKLAKAYKTAQIYVTIKPWLVMEVGIPEVDITNLLNDDNIKKVIESLDDEFLTQEDSGLIYELKALGNESITSKLPAVEKFVIEYHKTYKKKIEEDIKVDLPFKYKLIIATMQNVDFMDPLERSPLIAMYVVDTIDFLSDSNLELIEDETLYQSIVKILIPLYILKTDKDVLNEAKMNEVLNGFDDSINKIIVTEDFVDELVYAFLTANYTNTETGEEELYVEYLLNSENSKMTLEALELLVNDDLFVDNTLIQESYDLVNTGGDSDV